MNHAPLTNSKHIMALLAIAAACPFVQAETAGYLSPSAAAGTSEFGYQSSINTRESARRQQLANEAKQLLQEGRSAYAEGKYKDALDKYNEAWQRIPKAPATTQQQEFIVKSIGDASIAVAMEYAKVGRYDDAEQLLLGVLEREPNNKRARQELSLLRDPVRNNPALTPEHVKNVEEVNRLLTLAYGYYDLGQYDEAYAEFERVIRIDPYNTAARRGQEAVSKRRASYYATAHDSLRAKALADVSATWLNDEQEALPEISYGPTATAAPISEATIKNSNNLDAMEIATVNFEDTPMEEALDFLRGEARKRGLALNFIFEQPQAPALTAAAAAPADDEFGDEFEEDEFGDDTPASSGPVAVQTQLPEAIIKRLSVQNVSGKDLLQMMCSSAGCQYRIEDNAIVVYQTGAGVEKLFRRQWKVTRDFFDGSDEGGDDYDDSGFEETTTKRAKIDPISALKAAGVSFPKGATAQYSARTGYLTVNNTPDNLDAVEDAVNEFRRQMPQMIKVQAKFVEISQTNEEELSFDWVINPFSVSNSGDMYMGGVSGENASTTRTSSDFVSSGGSAYSNNYSGNSSWPISSSGLDSTSSISDGLVTGGNRSGSGAISGDTLTSMLESGSTSSGSSSSVAPGIMSLSGIFDSGSFQMIMRGLSQKKGVDIMSAPSLVARPGDLDFTPDPDSLLTGDTQGDNGCAKIEVVRRFIYPTEYEPPEIESSSSNYNNDSSSSYSSSGLPVASPANPSAWGVEEVGIILRFKVEELESNDIIKFTQFEIKVVDFEGFINYGSPITAGIANQDTIETVLLTENRIDMPIFQRRYVNTNPCIYDGHTIAIGGLIEDEIQKVEDKVPVLGDLPLIGRLFRSNAESHIQKNLMVFVTAEKIDPTGKPTRLRDVGTSDAPTSGASTPSLFPEDGLATP